MLQSPRGVFGNRSIIIHELSAVTCTILLRVFSVFRWRSNQNCRNPFRLREIARKSCLFRPSLTPYFADLFYSTYKDVRKFCTGEKLCFSLCRRGKIAFFDVAHLLSWPQAKLRNINNNNNNNNKPNTLVLFITIPQLLYSIPNTIEYIH